MFKVLLFIVLLLLLSFHTFTYKDPSEVGAPYKKGCDSGNAEDCHYLGMAYYWGHDYSRAMKFCVKACDGGFMRACSDIGYMYLRGKGVKKDFSKVEYFFEKACNGGETHTCITLGNMYLFGETVRKNISKSEEFYAKACDGGDMMDCYNLGRKYYKGEACAGDMSDCYKIIKEYKGEVIKQDFSKAKEFFKKSCDLGYSPGCNEYKRLNE